MATRYEKFLGTVPRLRACTRRELRILARLVDDICVPAGRQVCATEGAAMLVAGGHGVVLHDGSVLAVTPLRLLVVGRRELFSLLDEAPVLAACLLNQPGRIGAAVLPRAERGGSTTRAGGLASCAVMGEAGKLAM